MLITEIPAAKPIFLTNSPNFKTVMFELLINISAFTTNYTSSYD